MINKKFTDFKSTHDKVKFLLETNPALRHDDMKLVPNFWLNELGKENIEDMNAFDLLAKINNKSITTFETIKRCRQRLQKKFEHLRTEGYGKHRGKDNKLFKVNIREK